MSCSGPGRSTSTPTTAKNSSAGSGCCAASSSRSCATYSGKAPRYKRSRGLARNLLKVWPALWTFADQPRRQADQQPRRTRAPRRRHLPQALARQPIRARRTPDRAAALRLTPPAAYNTAPSSTTSPNSSPPTAAATHTPARLTDSHTRD